MRAGNLFVNTAALGALLALLLIPTAGASAYLGLGGPTAYVGPGPVPTSDIIYYPSRHDDPPPHGRADDPPPHG